MPSTSAKIAGLTFIPAGVLGISQLHYVVSHLATIATGATAIGLGVAVWGGHSVIGKIKGLPKRKAQPAPEAVEQSAVDAKIAELAEQLRQRPQALPKPTTVIDYTAAGQDVARASKRLV